MLTRIDKTLLTLAQAVVETTQIRPAKWLRIPAYPMALGTGCEVVFKMHELAPAWNVAVCLLSGLVCAWGTYWMGRSDATAAHYGELDIWRHTVLVVAPLLWVGGVFAYPGLLEYVLGNLAGVSIFLSIYFAACKPPTPRPPTPRPPKAKTKAVPALQGGEA